MNPATPAMTRDEAARLLAISPFHEYLGLRLTEWSHGLVRFTFRPPAAVRSGEAGVIHGGAIATVLDTAGCFAVISAVGVDCSTVDLRTDYLRPASADELMVTGTLLRSGRRLGWADAVLAAPDGKVAATARGTFTW